MVGFVESREPTVREKAEIETIFLNPLWRSTKETATESAKNGDCIYTVFTPKSE